MKVSGSPVLWAVVLSLVIGSVRISQVQSPAAGSRSGDRATNTYESAKPQSDAPQLDGGDATEVVRSAGIPQVIEAGQLPPEEVPPLEKRSAVPGQSGAPQAVGAGQLPPAEVPAFERGGVAPEAESGAPLAIEAGQLPPDEVPLFDKGNPPAESGNTGPDGSPDSGIDDEAADRSGECQTGYGCSNFNGNYPTGTFSTTSTSWTTVSTCIYGGEYAYYSVTSGQTYEWSLCSADGGSASYDSQLTLWNQGGTTRYCYSDDYCGDDAKIAWTATFSGTVRVLVSQYSCANNSTCTALVWRCASCSAPDTAVIYNAWWSNQVDQDGDGCKRSATLNWDPDVADCSGTLAVFEKIYWKPAGSGTWTLVVTTNSHTITDCSTADSQYVDWLFNSDCGSYDWRIEIYRVGQPSPDYTRDPSNDGDLDDHQEERASDDPGGGCVEIYDAWWTSPLDLDGDGCVQSARLNWDPDVCNCSGVLTVFEKIYWKPAGSGTWTLVMTTNSHTITDCSAADSQYVDWLFNGDCGPFDWKIEVYRSGQSSPDYTRDPSNDADLNDHQEERAEDDEGEPDIRVSPTSVSFDCTASLPGSGSGSGNAWGETLIGVNEAAQLAQVLAEVSSVGGRVLTTVDHRVAWTIGLSEPSVARLRAAGALVATDAQEAALLARTASDPTTAALAEAFARAVGVGREAASRYDEAHPLIDAWDTPPLSREAYLENLSHVGLSSSNPLVSALLGGDRGNSDDMTGTVTVAVMFVESDGSIDANTYTWTTAHEDEVLSGINSGLAWWASRAQEHGQNVSFNVLAYRHSDTRVQQGYEPITHASDDAPLWVNAVMADFGYSSGDHIARVTAFNTWLRANQGTDWAYTAFVCYNPPPAPTQYTDGYAAWAYLGGPYTNLLYRSFGWPFGQVFPHESGHIFQACDEYYQAGYGGCTSCGLCSHGVDNGNCEYCNPNAVQCMMRANSWALCTYTPGQLGWSGGPGDQCFMIYNDGGSALQVNSIAKPAWVTLNPPPPYIINGGASQQVCIDIDCGDCAGSDLDGLLAIHSDDPDEPTVNVTVHVDCPQVIGACCYAAGSCAVTTQADCSGAWHGEWTTCTPNNCPPPSAACCYPDGSCAVTEQAACTGVWHPQWTNCSEADCTCTGDLNCDGNIDFGDINPFVICLGNYSLWQTEFPGCNPLNADINGDGTYGQWSFDDINPFVVLMGQCNMGCACPGPGGRP
jgi:hypothetical protein